MAQGDILKRYLEAGMAFTQMTRERAEAIVQDLVENGEVRRKEAQKRVEEILQSAQKNTEDLVSLIRREVTEQLRNLGLEDLANRAGGDGGATPAANPSSVGTNPSETPNAADDSYPAPPVAAIKKAAKKAASSTKKAGAAKKATGAKKAGAAKKAGGAKKG
ncbi:MAG TPA: hypothetical protein VM345_09965 [Acidimicrobiales bacterium]|jgi:polyhydroxyalkanoate synthesis regulator phasin|nr:hypothetical protein [Acidimicrobiales bacterium]